MEGSLHTSGKCIGYLFYVVLSGFKKKHAKVSVFRCMPIDSIHRDTGPLHAKMKEEAQTVDSQWQNPLRHREVILQITTFSESLSQML